MMSYWSRMGSIQYNLCLYKKGKFGSRLTEITPNEDEERDQGCICKLRYIKDCQKPPEAN